MRPTPFLIGLMLACAAVPQGRSAPTGPDPAVAELLAQVRKKRGQEEWSGPETSARFRGTAWFHGTEADCEWRVDRTGAFRARIDGKVARVLMHDGSRTWMREGQGPAFPLQLYAREVALLETWVLSGVWTLADVGLEILLAEPEREDEVALTLRVEGGRLDGRLILDRTTLLPRRLSLPGNHGGIQLEMSDWIEWEEHWVPRRIVERLDGGLENRFVLSSAARDPAEVPQLETGAADTHFDRSQESRLEVRKARSGHLFVRPRINGEDVGWFLFDSGSGASMIAPEIADRLEIESFGEQRLTGLGPGVHETRMRRVSTLELGPLLVRDLVFIDRVGPDMASRMLGEPVAGVLGWDILLRAVVLVDPQEPRVELHDPTTFQLAQDAWRPLTLHWKVPYVSARFEGDREGLFCLDTGAGHLTVLFHAEAVEELGLLAERALVDHQGGGAGGDVAMKRGALRWFEVAGRRIEPAQALFSVGEDGEADPYAYGFLGGAFLSPFRTVFDYAGGRVAFVPRVEDGDDGGR